MKNILLNHLKKFFLCLLLLSLTTYLSVSAKNQDSLQNKKTSFQITYNQIPSVFQGMYRYSVVSEDTDQWKKYPALHKAQEYLTPLQLQNNSFEENFNFLRYTASKQSYEIDLASDLDLYYAVWRAKLITINNENELKHLTNYGAEYLINKGYSIEEILPFLSLLLQEHHDFHYDDSRTKSFGKNSKGIIPTVNLINNYNNYQQAERAGVCRDIHDVALRLLRQIGSTYYNSLYPDKNINIDNYLFLTSWATQSSQHVTVSFIDPLNTKKTYELDWGRLIKKNNNIGYEHGRNYGNAYRVWKFDSNKNVIKPIDSKKTSLGNFLDDQVYTQDEFDAFAGIKFVETYSAFKFEKKFKSILAVNTSLGTMSQNQQYAQATVSARFKEKKIVKHFIFNNTLAFQTLLLENTEKKNLQFPQNNYAIARALYFFPRYIGNIKSKKLKVSKNISCNFYAVGSIEAILYKNGYTLDSNKKDKFQSGDGGVYFSQGYQLNYTNASSSFNTEIKIQNRSFLISKDVRLMTPHPFELLFNAKIVSPAQDLIVSINYVVTPYTVLKTKSILEYTNQKNIITENQIELQNKINKIGYLFLSGAICKNLKGIEYFWNPVNRNRLELSYSNLKQNIKTGINVQQFTKGELVFGTQFNIAF